jgi:poly(3-hydroxybutyrate) depolymerase
LVAILLITQLPFDGREIASFIVCSLLGLVDYSSINHRKSRSTTMSRSMPMHRFAITAIGVASLVLPGLQAQPPAKKDAKGTQSRIEKKTYDFKDAGKEMDYALFVPSKYDKEKKTPLMLALHGLGGNPQGIMRSRGLTDLAEKHGYIVAAPMGYNEPVGMALASSAKAKVRERPTTRRT